MTSRMASNKSATADFLLCVLHQAGYLVPQDLKKALKLCKQAASKGNLDAQKTLAIILEESDFNSPFFEEALNWFVTTDNCVVPEGLHTAANLLTLAGENLRSSDRVMSLYERAAQLGYLPSRNNLALGLADRGYYFEACAHLSYAAEQGYELAQFNLERMRPTDYMEQRWLLELEQANRN